MECLDGQSIGKHAGWGAWRKEDPRPAIRPLAGLAPVQLPDDMSDWNQLGPECKTTLRMNFEWEGQSAHAIWVASTDSASVDITVNDLSVATAQLGRPLVPCNIVATNADDLPGLELLLLWNSPGTNEPVFGLTVFRLPPLVSP